MGVTNVIPMPPRQEANWAKFEFMPRVFSPARLARLVALNAVSRKLREWGVPVEEVLIDGQDGQVEPAVVLRYDPEMSFGALLDAAGPRRYITRTDGSVIVLCELDGVRVTWRMSAK